MEVEKYRVSGYLRWMAELTENTNFGLKAMYNDYFTDVPDDYNPDGSYLHIYGEGEDEGLYYVPGKEDLELLKKLKNVKSG